MKRRWQTRGKKRGGLRAVVLAKFSLFGLNPWRGKFSTLDLYLLQLFGHPGIRSRDLYEGDP